MQQQQVTARYQKGAADARGAARPAAGAEFSAAAANTLDRLLLRLMLEALGRPRLRLALWNGEEMAGADGAASSVPGLVIGDRGALLRLLLDPQLHFGEMYVAGRIEVSGSLAELLEIIYRALPRRRDPGSIEKWLAALSGARGNSLGQAVRNIHHHYDIGNEFYALWLDRQLVYTCAYFPEPEMDLEAAQVAKFEHVCRKLRLRPGQSVVEAGCGWGALALHMARQHGVTVKAYNLSREQLAHARARALAEGLADRVEFVEGDYREIAGTFDAFVSVGMLEHVGLGDYRELGRVIDRCLARDGLGLIHSIGRDYPHPMNRWIERNIFPGACPASLAQMMEIFEPCGFSVLDVENLRLHYARTIEHWQRRFGQVEGRVAAMFDAAFVRAWRLYLAGSLAAFRSGDMQLFQISFARSGANGIPWSRRDV